MIIVRDADDVVVGFERASDASRFLDAMRARLEEFPLSLHPDKTRLIEFGRYATERRMKKGLGKPETFNFLGFTHICGRAETMPERPHAGETQRSEGGTAATTARAYPGDGTVARPGPERLLQLLRGANEL
jgi:hypothetical protein